MGVVDLFMDSMKQTISKRAFKELADDVDIVPAALSKQAGVVGTIQLALDAFFATLQ